MTANPNLLTLVNVIKAKDCYTIQLLTFSWFKQAVGFKPAEHILNFIVYVYTFWHNANNHQQIIQSNKRLLFYSTT